MQDGDNGKKKVVKMGMAPIQREGMEYEFTTFFDIASNSIATATKDRTDLFATVNAAGTLEKKEFIITPETGKILANWINTGADIVTPPLVLKIKEIFNPSTLPNDSQGKWIRENINDLESENEATLQKVYDYLTNLTKKENDNE